MVGPNSDLRLPSQFQYGRFEHAVTCKGKLGIVFTKLTIDELTSPTYRVNYGWLRSGFMYDAINDLLVVGHSVYGQIVSMPDVARYFDTKVVRFGVKWDVTNRNGERWRVHPSVQGMPKGIPDSDDYQEPSDNEDNRYNSFNPMSDDVRSEINSRRINKILSTPVPATPNINKILSTPVPATPNLPTFSGRQMPIMSSESRRRLQALDQVDAVVPPTPTPGPGIGRKLIEIPDSHLKEKRNEKKFANLPILKKTHLHRVERQRVGDIDVEEDGRILSDPFVPLGSEDDLVLRASKKRKHKHTGKVVDGGEIPLEEYRELKDKADSLQGRLFALLPQEEIDRIIKGSDTEDNEKENEVDDEEEEDSEDSLGSENHDF